MLEMTLFLVVCLHFRLPSKSTNPNVAHGLISVWGSVASTPPLIHGCPFSESHFPTPFSPSFVVLHFRLNVAFTPSLDSLPVEARPYPSFLCKIPAQCRNFHFGVNLFDSPALSTEAPGVIFRTDSTSQAQSRDARNITISKSDVPAAPTNTALGGKASLQPKRTPVSEKEIEAILLGGCF